MDFSLKLQIFLSNGDRLWPASIFPKGADYGVRSIKDVAEVEHLLEEEGEVFVSASSYDRQGNRLADCNRIFKKDELFIIQGPIRAYKSDGLSVKEVFGLSEAARLWGIEGGGATIRKAYERGQFNPDEIRKSDSIILVTYPGMQRRYNALTKEQWSEIPIYYVHKGAIQDEAHWLLNEPEIRAHYEAMSQIARRPRKASGQDMLAPVNGQTLPTQDVFYHVSDGIYQVFPDKSRQQVEFQGVQQLVDYARTYGKSYVLIHESSVEMLKIHLGLQDFTRIVNPEAVQFYHTYGLITDEEYEAFQRERDMLLMARTIADKLVVIDPSKSTKWNPFEDNQGGRENNE